MTKDNHLQSGTLAPAFKATDHTGAMVALDDFAGSKLIMYFYPKAFTPGCTAESCDFRDNHKALSAAGYQIVGISPDEPGRLAEFKTEHNLSFPLLSDEDHAIAKAYGAWGTKKNYGREYEGMIRSTFAIDEQGTIQRAWYNIRAKGHAARVTRELA
ncbi:MAG: thioredoxin-dependent thiol peroxidase [Acidimicrobiia bacterium]|nr:thioredoxin-dependent thiol peroxidase [Acidimicrobiia bacterium]